jgi:hypothetical protein
MNTRHWLLSLIALSLGSLAAGCGGDDSDSSGDTATIADLCTSTCTTAKSLGCSAETTMTVADCASACNAALTLYPNCESQLHAYLSCADAVPASGWVCDSNNESNLGGSLCSSESTAMDTCISSS